MRKWSLSNKVFHSVTKNSFNISQNLIINLTRITDLQAKDVIQTDEKCVRFHLSDLSVHVLLFAQVPEAISILLLKHKEHEQKIVKKQLCKADDKNVLSGTMCINHQCDMQVS